MEGTGTKTGRETETKIEIETGRDTGMEERETEMHDSGTEILKFISNYVLSSHVTGA